MDQSNKLLRYVLINKELKKIHRSESGEIYAFIDKNTANNEKNLLSEKDQNYNWLIGKIFLDDNLTYKGKQVITIDEQTDEEYENISGSFNNESYPYISEKNYYIKYFGEISWGQLAELASEGRIGTDNLIFVGRILKWKYAKEIPNLFSGKQHLNKKTFKDNEFKFSLEENRNKEKNSSNVIILFSIVVILFLLFYYVININMWEAEKHSRKAKSLQKQVEILEEWGPRLEKALESKIRDN